MSVTFTIYEASEKDGSSFLDFVDGAPELNVCNSNARDLLWYCFDLRNEDLVGELDITEAIDRVTFWIAHGGPKAMVSDGSVVTGAGGCTVVNGGRSFENMVRYSRLLTDILGFGTELRKKGRDVMLGWG